jgi:protocatechuate 3,4-dioxygenase beta subunit
MKLHVIIIIVFVVTTYGTSLGQDHMRIRTGLRVNIPERWRERLASSFCLSYCFSQEGSTMERIFSILGIMVLLAVSVTAYAETCSPTEPDMLGPFYKPGAPVRSSVGTGYVLAGSVRSSPDCALIPGATIEIWLAGPDGIYDDDHRATVIADQQGAYRFESNVPPPYYGRPPHIHLRVSAKGFRTLVTQHYREQDRTQARFDIILVPAK